MLRRNFIVGNSAVLTACASDDIAPTPVDVKPVKPKKPEKTEKTEKPAEGAHEGDHSHHHGHDGHVQPDHGLLDAASECVQKGQLCIQHCLVLLGQGDTSMVECAQAVSDMLAVTQAIAALAAASSRHLKAQVAVGKEVCERCKAACDVHAGKHPTCRDCAEACGAALTAYARALG